MAVIYATIPGVGDTSWYTETICPGLVTWQGLYGIFLEIPRHRLRVELEYMNAAQVGVSQFYNFLGMMPNFYMRLRGLKEICPYL